MKRIIVTQAYEIGVSIEVDVPDDWTEDEMVDAFTDFPIRADVNAVWEDTVNVQVVGVCIDYLDSLTGDEALTITDPEETEQ